VKSLPLFLLVLVVSAGFAACTTFGSSASDGGIEPSSDAQSDTSVTIPAEAGALDASSPDASSPDAWSRDASSLDASPPDAETPVDSGRSWKAFFVTKGKINGALAGAGGGGTPFLKADQLCNQEASAAGLRGQFVALVRSNTTSTLTERVSASSGARYLPNGGANQGPLLVANIASPPTVALAIAPNYYASGGVAPSDTRVWTGGSSASAAFCSGSAAPWTSASTTASGTVGNPSNKDGLVGEFETRACDQTHSLYCVEE
jgi:hypothetical protein